MRSSMSRSEWLLAVITTLCLAFAGLYVILRLLKEMMDGRASAWRQGDWLINRDLIEVRRGPLGSWIIDLADLAGLDPLQMTYVIQAVLTAAMVALVIHLFWLARHPRLLALMILSPGFVVIFWLADHQGAFRKELIAFVALLLTLQALWTGWGLVLGAVVFAVSVYGHEANILLLPIYLVVLWLGRAHLPVGAGRWWALGVVLAGALHALWYSVVHREVSTPARICEPLLERGLDPALCDGAIAFLSNDFQDALTLVAAENFNLASLGTFVLMYALALLPVFLALSYATRDRQIWVMVLVLVLPFLPLYGIAIDWGRWISLHYFSIVVLVLVYLRVAPEAVRGAPPVSVVAGLMPLALLWAPSHTVGVHWLWIGWITTSVAEMLGGTLD